MKITDVPEGPAVGRQDVRTAEVTPLGIEGYFRIDANILGRGRLFHTGDVAPSTERIHADHRSLQGLIKSGGEWISSIDLENLAVDIPRSRRPP